MFQTTHPDHQACGQLTHNIAVRIVKKKQVFHKELNVSWFILFG